MLNNIGYKNNNVNFNGHRNILSSIKKQFNTTSNKIEYPVKDNMSKDIFVPTNSQTQHNIKQESCHTTNSKDYLSEIFGEDSDPITWFLGMIMP